MSVGYVLPLVFVCLAQQNSCKTRSNKQSGNEVSQTGVKQTGKALPEGTWGGVHISMEVTAKGAAIEYDCAHGTISEPLRVDNDGRFQAKGTHVREHGGPIRNEETPVSHPASYSGKVNDKTITLTVTLTDSSETIGTFTLTQGSEGQLFKCR